MRTPFTVLAPAFLLSFLTLPLLGQQSGDFTYTSSGGAVTITKYTGSGGAVTVPSTIAGQPVTRLANEAFHSIASVTQVTLPNSLTYIGRGTFAHCTGLSSVNFGSGLTTIDYSAFYRCTSLTWLNLPSGLTILEEAAFRECSGLAGVTFPESLTSIGLRAFSDCSSLVQATFMGNAPATFGDLVFSSAATDFKILYHKNKTGFTSPLWNGYSALPMEFNYVIEAGSVFITGYTGTGGAVRVPDTLAGLPVTRINPEAFHAGISPNNKDITGIVLPDTVTYIGWGAFAGCSGLTSVGLGSGLTMIDQSAFYACTGLTAITIPASVTNVQASAFGLTGLTEATFVGNAPTTLDSTVFPPSNFTVYYYDGKTGFSTPLWRDYPAVKLGGTHGSIEAWRSRHFGTTANSGTAADNADPDGDGVSNLVEFAFNTNPHNGNNGFHISPAGIKGLPLTYVIERNGSQVLRTEFVRRKGASNLRYTVVHSESLASASWVTVPDATTVTPIDADWERVVNGVRGINPIPRIFARVMVEKTTP